MKNHPLLKIFKGGDISINGEIPRAFSTDLKDSFIARNLVNLVLWVCGHNGSRYIIREIKEGIRKL